LGSIFSLSSVFSLDLNPFVIRFVVRGAGEVLWGQAAIHRLVGL
jgi:hypothetical protein